MISGTLTAVPISRERVQRQYLDMFVVGWYTHVIELAGQYTRLRETAGFGGYRMHFFFTDDFWNWNSSTWDRTNTFVNVYASPPGSMSPISFGSAQWVYKWAFAPINGGVLNFQLTPNDGHYTAIRLPPAPSDYWAKNPKTYPATLQFHV